MQTPYTMNVETANKIETVPLDPAADLSEAKVRICEMLRRPEVRSVALRRGHKTVRIYDFRDLPENADVGEAA